MKNISIFFSALVALLFSVAETSAQITPPYYNPANVNITGGNINGTVIGGTTPAAATFTTVWSTNAATLSSTKIGVNNDLYLTRYGAKQLMISGDGVGATTNAGWIGGYNGVSGTASWWVSTIVPSDLNHAVLSNGSSTYLNGISNSFMSINGTQKFSVTATATTSGNPLFVADTTDSSSTTTGALRTAGGLGVAKKAYFGDAVNVTNLITASNATVGGAIGTAFQHQIVNTHVAVGDWIGTAYRWIAGDATTTQAYIGAVLTSSASNGLSDLVFGVKTAAGDSAVTEKMRLASTALTLGTGVNLVGAGSLISSGANTVVAASQTVVDNSGSVARFIGFGPDAGTNATVRISSVRSDGTNEVQYDFSGTGLAVTGGISATGDVAFGKTITTPGTTGAQTINKTTGRVNFAAAATSLVVTNSLATANSICHVTKATNDATMRLGACVAAAGSITIYADVAPAAETAVNFTVTN